ncbi:MAG: MarR family transcriptional regulator [Ilumatobacteraceae bacterium]
MERLGRQLYLTFRTMRDRADAELAASGASMSQWALLKTVGDEPDLSQRELADRVLLTGSTLTHHLDRLEADGFIDRTRDTADRRIVRVSLTPSGKDRRTELDAIVASGDATIRTLLSERDYSTLNRLLATLQQRLEDHEGAPRGP